MVITVKKHKSVKFTLQARALNNEIGKDKDQIPSLERLFDVVAEQLDDKDQGKALYSSLDMGYAYGQVPLDEEKTKHCNVRLIGG